MFTLRGSICQGLLLCSFATFGVYQLGSAQQSGNPPIPDEVSVLRTEVKILAAQQQQILEQLAEIKRVLAVNAAGRPAPQPSLPAALAIGNAPGRGDPMARIAVIEFADFECPFCGKFQSEVYPSLAENYIATGKVRYFFRDLPLPMHPHAMPAARAARCAGEQDKYWEMHDSLFAGQALLTNASFFERARALGLDTAKFEQCLARTRSLDEIRASVAEAQKMGITGTPTFLLGTVDPGGQAVTVRKIIRGALPYETFKIALDALLVQIETEK